MGGTLGWWSIDLVPSCDFVIKKLKKKRKKDFPGGPVAKTPELPMQRGWV